MKKTFFLAVMLVMSAIGVSFAEGSNLVIDDFEVSVSGGPEGTVDFGAGNGSTVSVSAASDIKNSGQQAIKVVYDATGGGYIYVARGTGLDAKNANWGINPA
ncbi:MAG: hypothetical protein WCY09_05735, partial [Candidatus Omnitrophota bacterium]